MAAQHGGATARANRGGDGWRGFPRALFQAVVLGLLAALALLLLFSTLYGFADPPLALMNPLASLILLAGAMAAGWRIGFLQGKKVVPSGALAGCLIFLIFALGALLSNREIGLLALVKLAIALFSGSIGAILGAGRRARTYRIKPREHKAG